MPLIQLAFLFFVILVIRSIIPLKQKIVLFVASFFLAFLFTIQFSSVLFTGNIADYRFYENLNISDALSVAGFFSSEGVLLIAVLIISCLIFYFFKIRLKSKRLVLIAFLVGVLILSVNGGIIRNAYETLSLKLSRNVTFNQALTALNIDERDYVKKNEITAKKGRNIVVLSLESLEKGYLGENLRHLTPNLTRLAEKYTLIDMNQSPAGEWTSGSMYIALTGVPAYFGLHGNSIFQASHENILTSMPDVLQKAGYDLQYYLGKKEYSGMDKLLELNGFEVRSEKDFKIKYQPVPWGIQDLDLFEEFKKELIKRKESQKPFALFLSTISTHFPNGIPDKRIDSLLPPQRSQLELMVSATDYSVGSLIDFLEKENMLSNTTFFIYPDHLLMGKTSPVIDDFENRQLYLLTNANLSTLEVAPNTTISQIEIPSLILKGAEVDHNARFLSDFITIEDKNSFLRKHSKKILQLNEAALTTLNFKNGIAIETNKKKDTFYINNAEGTTLISSKILKKGFAHRIQLDTAFRPINSFVFNFSKASPNVNSPFHLDIFESEGNLYASLRDNNDLGLLKKESEKIIFKKEEIDLLKNLNLQYKPSKHILVNSNSWNSEKNSSFSLKGKIKSVSRGITAISLNSSNELDYRTFDTHGSIDDAQEMFKTLESFLNDNTTFILLAHDSAAKELTKFSEELSKLGLQKLSGLKERQAYIAHNINGKIFEAVDGKNIRIELRYPSSVKNSKLYFTEPKIKFKTEKDRYVAHAGGEIDGVKYTNSLEALNFSYQMGFRIFELDIIQTSDGNYVAAHDWDHWKKETGYTGGIPVSLSVFKKQKFQNKFTPLDMSAINQWFSQHPDAVLVTDKTNTPNQFASQFVDKERLIMELFSLDAVHIAIKNGVTPLVSEKVIREIEHDIVPFLVKNNIKYVGLSRRGVTRSSKFLKECREKGIKVYVYHVNFDEGKDEKHVFNNELGIVYGMYADKWLPEFKEPETLQAP